MSLKSFKPFKNNQTGLIWKLRIHTFQKQRAHLLCNNCVLKNFTKEGAASGFYSPRKIDTKVPSKQTSQLSLNFNLILDEWRVENEKF